MYIYQKMSCIKANIREIDKVPSTKYLFHICQANGPCYTKPNLF